MEREEQDYGKLNPDAPQELAQFAFLIGPWRCAVKLKREDGSWETLEARWEGRFILDGYAIADEYRMTSRAGGLLVLGVNLRAYNPAKKAWSMKWLNALVGSWVDLGPEELGGVQADGQRITYCTKEPVAAHALTRATYSSISGDHFSYRGERSNDGKTWDEFIAIEAYRNEG